MSGTIFAGSVLALPLVKTEREGRQFSERTRLSELQVPEHDAEEGAGVPEAPALRAP